MNPNQAAADFSAAAMTRSKRRRGFSAGRKGVCGKPIRGFLRNFNETFRGSAPESCGGEIRRSHDPF